MRDPGARLTWLERRKHHVESVLDQAESHYQHLEDEFTESQSHDDITAREYARRLRTAQSGGGALGEAWRTYSRLKRWLRLYKLMVKQMNRTYYDSRGIGTGG